MRQDALLGEIREFKTQLPGVTKTIVATVDGILVTDEDGEGGAYAETLAAMSAATLSLGQRTAQETRSGHFRETVTRCAAGFIAVYAVGESALLLVLAEPGINFARLHIESRAAIKRITEIMFGKIKENL